MKKMGIILILLVLVMFFTSGSVFAQSKEKTTAVKKEQVQKKTTTHEKGSKECTEKHTKGECTGHDAGKCTCDHTVEKNKTEKCTGTCTDDKCTQTKKATKEKKKG